MTKLASVQRILELNPIPGADKIETATVLGWQVIVKKGEYKVGDLCAYIQIDTVVPADPEYEFMRQRDFRVRTIKLRGQLSQGLIVPLPQGKWNEDDDLTEAMKIKKYSKDKERTPRINLPKKPKKWYRALWWVILYKYFFKWFPQYIPVSTLGFPTDLVGKTDEERIQNMPRALETYKGKKFIVTEKLNGSSITLLYSKKHRNNVRVCSRNFELVKPDDNFHPVVESTKFWEHLQKLVDYYKTNDIIVQGEYIGKPQANYHKIGKNEIRLFNIIVKGKRLLPEEMKKVVGELDIPHCPYIAELPLNFTLPEILAFAESKSALNPEVEREGLVFRCVDDGMSFKVISNKYLLDNGE